MFQIALGAGEPYAGNGSYELNTYLLFFGTPHAALGMAITLAALWVLIEARERLDSPRVAILAGCIVALGLLHPFNLVSVALGAGVLVALAWLERREWRRPLAAATIVGLSAGPFVIYNGLTFALDPFWGAVYGAQNKLPSPAPAELLVDLGVLLLGLAGIVVAWQAGGVPRRIAMLAAVLCLSMYAPVPFQRRLGFGLAPLLAVLTVMAVAWWGERRPWMARLVSMLLVTLGLSSTLFFYGGMLVSVRVNTPIPAYRATPDLAAARDWLATNGHESDVVLGSWDVMNFLAGDFPGRTAGGHPVATTRVDERRALARELFESPEQQRAIVHAEGATYVVSSTLHEPLFIPELSAAFQSGEVVVARYHAEADR
jgi:chromate transport protein ChrA